MEKVFRLKSDSKLTDKQREEIKNARNLPYEPDSDCPAYSYDELRQMLIKTKDKVSPTQKHRHKAEINKQ